MTMRDYLRQNLTAADFSRLPEILNITPTRLTKLLNYNPQFTWSFDEMVILIRKLNLEITPSNFIKELNINHNLSDLEIEALDKLLDD